MTCPSSWDPVCAPITIASGIASSTGSTATNAAWDAVCKSFGAAASWLLGEFMATFQGIPDVNLRTAGIAGAYGASIVLGSVVAALIILGQVIRTAWTRDGTGLAQALSGTIKTLLAWLLTAAVATAGIEAADSATRYITAVSHDAEGQLVLRLGNVLTGITSQPPEAGQALLGGTLLMIIGLIVILLVIVLWVELLLRNAALAVVIAVSPIAAAGQAGGEATRAWWPRTAGACAQLIILKPVVALVFAVGFGMGGASSGMSSLLEGLLVLGLAAFSWPVIARFFTFASIQATSSGLATALGFLAGRASAGGRGTAGVSPDQFGQAAEARVMGARGGAGAPAGGAGRGGAALAGVQWAIRSAHQAGSAVAGRMEQTAAHAGMHGAYPYSQVGGPRTTARQTPPPPGAPPRQDGAAAAGPGGSDQWPWDRPAGEE